jgi:putative PIN family toxin of toxin-antitoxin system
MKVTVNTNVLISSTFWYGSSFKIIKKVENKEIELILSREILEGFMNVLDYKEIQQKIKNKNLEMKRTFEKIISISRIVKPEKRFNVVKEDSEDNKIIKCAIREMLIIF